jgi:hypothetical protein
MLQRMIVLALCALGGRSGVLVAQDTRPGFITGLVVDTTGAPVGGAIVQATALASHLTRVARTSDDGRYGLRFDTGEDRYEIVVRSPGLLPSRFVLAGGRAHILVGNVQLAPVNIPVPAVAVRPVSSWFWGNRP